MYRLRLNWVPWRSHKAEVISIPLQRAPRTSAGQDAWHNECPIKNTFAAALNFTSKTVAEERRGGEGGERLIGQLSWRLKKQSQQTDGPKKKQPTSSIYRHTGKW